MLEREKEIKMESVGGKAEKNIYLGKQSEKLKECRVTRKKKRQSVRKEEGKVYKRYKQF